MTKDNRRTYGDGALFQRSKGMWVARLELGWDSHGKRSRWQAESKTQSGALAKLRTARAQRDTLGSIPATGKPLADWMETWLADIVKPSVKPKTYLSYSTNTRKHIIPKLGKVPVGKLTPGHVRQLRQTVMAATSLSTANTVHRILKVALSDAEREGLVPRNVAKLVQMPSARSGRDALSPEDVRTIFEGINHDANEARWLVSLLTGARQGEAIGITWDRIDLDAGTIDLAWQLQRLPMIHGCTGAPGKPPCGHKRASSCPSPEFDVAAGFEYTHIEGPNCITRPKSASGIRIIPIPPALVKALKQHRKAHFHVPNPYGLVFTRDDGGPMDPKVDRAEWIALLGRLQVPAVDLHSTRHTVATPLMAQGVDVKIIQAIMGHANATTTQIYQHADQTMARAALQGLADSLG